MKAVLSGKEAKAVRQVEKNLAVRLGIPLDKIEMTGLEYDTANSIYNSYTKVLNQYPELRGHLTEFKYGGVYDDAYAGCIAMYGKIKAYDAFANYEGLVKCYADDVAAGFHPVGTDHNSIIVHELGHALDGYMTKQGLCGGIVKSCRSSKKIQELVMEQLGWNAEYVDGLKKELKSKGFTNRKVDDIIKIKKEDFIAEHVSKYAADNEKEFFAECFAEYVMSENPRKAARIFGEIVESALGR